MKKLFTQVLLTLIISTSGMGVASAAKIDSRTGAKTWETSNNGVTVSMTQILPDQARAFYVNRGFPLEVAEEYATACIFMTVLRNDAASGVVHFKQEDWRIISGQHEQPPLSLASWMQRWEEHDLDKPALLAFRWAQFPQEHWYEPAGDWNQGMLTTGLAAGSTFNLTARWDVAGDPYEVTLNDVECAK